MIVYWEDLLLLVVFMLGFDDLFLYNNLYVLWFIDFVNYYLSVEI